MWVSLVAIDVLFKVELVVAAVGWQVWVSLMLKDMPFKLLLGVAVVG